MALDLYTITHFPNKNKIHKFTYLTTLLIVVLIEKNLILDGAENLSFLYNREMAVTFENLEIIADLCDIIFIEKYEIQKTFEGQVLVWIEGVYGEDLLLCFEVYFVFGRNFVAVVERLNY